MDTGMILKNLRLSKEYTLEYVGNYVGVSKSTVKRWEDGDISGIGSDKLILLAKLYGVTPHYIVGWEDEKGNLTYNSDDGKPTSNTCGFSDAIKRIRLKRNMTQQEFADLLGTSKQNISRYEKGEVTPMVTTALKIAATLGITLEELNGEPMSVHAVTDSKVKNVIALAEQLSPENLELASDFLAMLLNKQ